MNSSGRLAGFVGRLWPPDVAHASAAGSGDAHPPRSWVVGGDPELATAEEREDMVALSPGGFQGQAILVRHPREDRPSVRSVAQSEPAGRRRWCRTRGR